MAAFGSSFDRPLYGRGPSPGLRFVLFALLCLMFMYLDQRGRWTERMRYGLQGLAYPIQWAVNSPQLAWRSLGAGIETRGQLRTENEQLRQQQHADELALLRLKALEQENQELRGLKAALPELTKKWQLAEVISVDVNPLRQRLVINRGASSGAFANQAVVDAKGVLGQVIRVGPLSAEVLLITDPESGIPVQVLRNGLRTIAVGSGAPNDLLLPYLAVNADIKSGDQLVTSGMGGVYPAGYPVAEITGVFREDKQLLAQVHARPLAGTGSSRELMLLEFEANHPDAPHSDVAHSDVVKGSPLNRERDPLLAVWLTALSGLVLSIVPLNYWLGLFRPQFAALVVLYWSIMSPRSGGILLGFVCGMMLDVFSGSLLGEHALALALMAYLGIRLNLLLRAKPLFQQSLFVLAALVLYELVLWAIDGWSGHGLSSPLRWLAALSGALIWPILVGILGRMHTEH